MRNQLRSNVNKQNKKRIDNLNLENFILKHIKRYWSPEQIA
jgi:IS30 family transposase